MYWEALIYVLYSTLWQSISKVRKLDAINHFQECSSIMIFLQSRFVLCTHLVKSLNLILNLPSRWVYAVNSESFVFYSYFLCVIFFS